MKHGTCGRCRTKRGEGWDDATHILHRAMPFIISLLPSMRGTSRGSFISGNLLWMISLTTSSRIRWSHCFPLRATSKILLPASSRLLGLRMRGMNFLYMARHFSTPMPRRPSMMAMRLESACVFVSYTLFFRSPIQLCFFQEGGKGGGRKGGWKITTQCW